MLQAWSLARLGRLAAGRGWLARRCWPRGRMEEMEDGGWRMMDGGWWMVDGEWLTGRRRLTRSTLREVGGCINIIFRKFAFYFAKLV